jgi:hypothetical protein
MGSSRPPHEIQSFLFSPAIISSQDIPPMLFHPGCRLRPYPAMKSIPTWNIIDVWRLLASQITIKVRYFSVAILLMEE